MPFHIYVEAKKHCAQFFASFGAMVRGERAISKLTNILNSLTLYCERLRA